MQSLGLFDVILVCCFFWSWCYLCNVGIIGGVGGVGVVDLLELLVLCFGWYGYVLDVIFDPAGVAGVGISSYVLDAVLVYVFGPGVVGVCGLSWLNWNY